jgi:AcrR family transcriptional regulator
MTQDRSARRADDGRLLRSERSRELIADALYELLREGDIEPSAQKVADRAGVGIRTVFRLFSDMDALYATVNARLESEVAPMLRAGPSDAAAPGGRMHERAEALISERVALFERVGIYMRFTNRNRDRSAFLASHYRKLTMRLRDRLLHWLPELRAAPPALVEALDQATSFEAWDRLRGDQRLSRLRAQAAMECATESLLKALKETK